MENSQNKITAEKRRQYYEKFVDKNKEKVV